MKFIFVLLTKYKRDAINKTMSSTKTRVQKQHTSRIAGINNTEHASVVFIFRFLQSALKLTYFECPILIFVQEISHL